MKLQADEWARVLRYLDTALDLAEAERQPWLEGLELPPRLKDALAQLLGERRALETADFLGAGPDLSRQPEFHLGETLGPWRLLRELGTGGMASVWLAERNDGAHARQVALKLPHRLLGSRAIAERFVRERAILSTLQHPNIAQVLDAGDTAGQPWLALEFVAGRPITEHAAALGLSVRQRLKLFLQVLQAVQHAHGQLVIHRDLKPANVWVAEDGTVKLLDFGVAKLLQPEEGRQAHAAETTLTRLGGRAMTPQYASPEQVAGRPLGVASDVYSLGVLLYELLTGRLPYTVQRDTAAALEEAILSADVQRPSHVVGDAHTARALRGDLDTVVMKALQAQPGQRYVSAEALANDLQRHLESEPILARPDTVLYRLRKLWGRHRLALSAAAAVTVAVLGGSGLALWQAEQARAEGRRAEAVQTFLLDIFKANSGRLSDPQKARATTARELLDLGAERIQA
jgi:eukaryotic-like serine/threonine-protein kinase